MPAHSALTGADLHEPKGVAAASANTAYIADGAGSGAWAKIDADNIDTSSILNLNKHVIVADIQDVSTADKILLAFPAACTVTRITGILSDTITTGNATVTFTNNGASSLGSMTVGFSGSSEGDTFTLTPASNNTFTAGSYIKVATDGGSTGTAHFTIVIEYTLT